MEAIRRAAEGGVTFFDTAQAYGFGQSEQLLAAERRGFIREDLVIATKGGLVGPTAQRENEVGAGQWSGQFRHRNRSERARL
jgi:aryl-alcohol dehydrogenase-like predicted oxidoreductase